MPGEAEYIGRGVAFCPHCDGPFFKGKDIAVIGGGNSGIEAAIDLAGICRSVVVLEYMDELRADIVLQEKLAQLPNVTVRRGIATREVLGDGKSVVGLRIAPRDGGDEETLRRGHLCCRGVYDCTLQADRHRYGRGSEGRPHGLR